MRQHTKTPHYLTGFGGLVGSHTPIHWGSSRTDGRTDGGRTEGRRTDGRTDGGRAQAPIHCDWGGGACFKSWYGLGKSLPERNLGFLGLRDGRRPSPATGVVASFFASFFSIDFWKAFFRFLVIFGPPWGTPKSPKISKSRPWRPSFFRAHALLAFLPDF